MSTSWREGSANDSGYRRGKRPASAPPAVKARHRERQIVFQRRAGSEFPHFFQQQAGEIGGVQYPVSLDEAL